MTPEQLTLARQFLDVMKWDTMGGYFDVPSKVDPQKMEWLFTGDGLLAVKAEMAKQGASIASGPLIPTKAFAYAIYSDGSRDLMAINADTEPHAVLLAAVAAMKVSANE